MRSVSHSPSADVSVRIAWADDADAIAARPGARLAGDVRRRGARPTPCPTDPRPGPAWRQSLGRPADARHRVLVALERNRVVGFALTGPAEDPDCDPVADGALAEMTLDPAERGKGHGSRLLQAAVDTLVADRFTRAVTWLLASDDDQRRFLTEAGWAADGAHRELDLDGSGETTVKQVRLHTAIG